MTKEVKECFKLMVEVNVEAENRLNAIHLIENVLEEYKDIFDVKRCVSCSDWLVISYGEIINE